MADKAPSSWTIGSLHEALTEAAPDEISVERIEGSEPVLVATMRQCGDLPIFISVGSDQIAVSTLLWPVDEQEDAAAFNTFLLKAQKVVPLSNFAITIVEGRDFYELMGELAAESSLSMILLELRVLAENALAAADDLRQSFAAA